ncbi:hypothetical protein TNCV_2784361 [Trichonephila clavipes]|nr:hypothetical protein TNCV_2784361 [Trichonephila clavipes]
MRQKSVICDRICICKRNGGTKFVIISALFGQGVSTLVSLNVYVSRNPLHNRRDFPLQCKLSSRTLIAEVIFVSPLMIASKAALESEKIANPTVVPESSRWVEYRMSASLIARKAAFSLDPENISTDFQQQSQCLEIIGEYCSFITTESQIKRPNSFPEIIVKELMSVITTKTHSFEDVRLMEPSISWPVLQGKSSCDESDVLDNAVVYSFAQFLNSPFVAVRFFVANNIHNVISVHRLDSTFDHACAEIFNFLQNEVNKLFLK